MLHIYDIEKKDGLEDRLLNNSIAYTSTIYNKELSHNIDVNDLRSKGSSLALSENFGLFPLDSILVSTGWNSNDDVFTRDQTWAAKMTPVDKPVNFMHDEKDIIGHMISSLVIDRNNKIVGNDVKEEEVPDDFDIVVGAVLYTEWSDEKQSSRVDSLIKEISEGKWFVSMECVFNDFDYAVISPNGECKTIARNDKTCFLTKFLKIYGGSGKYQGYKIGRQLKNFAFIGKGIVDNPANERSIILNNFKSQASLSNFTLEKVNVMDEEKILAKFDSLDSAVKAINLDVVAEPFKKEIASLKSDLESSKAKELELTNKISTLEETLKTKDNEISLAKLEVVNIKRMTKAAVAGVPESEVANFVEKWSSLSEEQFDSVIAMQKKEEKVTASKVLESTKEEPQPNLVVAEEEIKIRAKASEWLSNNLFKKGKK